MVRVEPVPEVDQRFSDPNVTATPWATVRAALESAELFWISTVRSSGRPHVTPIPAVWRDDALYFCTGPAEQKGVNLERNGECVLTTGTNVWDQGLDVCVEGLARRVTDPALLGELAALWLARYDEFFRYEVRDGAFHHEGGEAYVFEVQPRKVVAFAKGVFAQTRFRFAGGDGR